MTIGGMFQTACNKCGGQGQRNSNPCGPCRGQKVAVENKTATVVIPAGINNGDTVRVKGSGGTGKLFSSFEFEIVKLTLLFFII